jgi:redox-sensitive bicupin YhaK (pirin superfamily)
MIIRSSPRSRDLGGGFHVRRLLPGDVVRTVGPFVFMDHMGPLELAPPMSVEVRPHPHIGLATVTYLFEGALMHRDTLGTVQRIEPGALNWMVAGRGIAHSERTPEDLRAAPHRMHGLQLWVGLPSEQQECEPSFSHTPLEAIPSVALAGGEARVLLGAAFGRRSPVPVRSETLFLHVTLPAGASLEIPAAAAEAAFYAITGSLTLNAEPLEPGVLAVLTGEASGRLETRTPCSLAIVGGAPLDGVRHLWWNFVSSRPERIREAAVAWQAQRFGTISGDPEFIPLPEVPPAYR